MPSDQELISAYLQRSDPDAYRAIVDRYAAFVYRVARSVTRDDAAAEDVSQEVFVSLLRRDPGLAKV